jgi:hypothetical protein
MLVNSTSAHAMSVSLIIRRIGVTLALAVVLTCGVALINEDAAVFFFLPSWIALFFGWPYLSRTVGFNFPKPYVPRTPRRTAWGRLFVTAFLSIGLSCTVAVIIHSDLFAPCFLFCWIALYYASPLLTKRLPYFGFARTNSILALPAPKRPVWLRLVRGSLAGIGFVFAFVLIPLMLLVPISLSHVRAKKVHDSINVGMTVPEVLHAAHDCDIFQASSDFPYDDKTDADNIPAVNFGGTRDGVYRTYDPGSRQNLNLSESEAVDRLHAHLHDGYPWHFHYTYINATPQHVTFIVDFGPDGRVVEVKPVYGWD